MTLLVYMANFDMVAFISWSSITSIFVVVTGLVYMKFVKRDRNESPPT
jgi:hypothetical protein